MPYRRAWLWIAALFPLIAIAFWPNYFSSIRGAPFALHAHGLTASAWMILAALQSWSITHRRISLHRAAGLATFVVVPMFAAGAVLGVFDMSARFATQSDPFNGTFGAALAMEDLLAGAVLVAMVAAGLAARRRVRAHAAWMLATVWLVLPPVTGRLFQHVPGFPVEGLAGWTGFGLAFQLAEWTAAVPALWLWSRDRRNGTGFLVAAVSNLVQSLMYMTVAQSDAWTAQARALGSASPVLPAAAAALVTFALLILTWNASRRSPVPAAAAAAI